ncbi:hypothetical protein HY989_03860 [Candidatus Micrarchaeota archaeon]|nr:hypothetical protein [Candidatus Micrarchaeota archaeon]
MIKRAQFSFDLLLVLGIMLIIFLLLFNYYTEKTQSTNSQQKQFLARQAASEISEIVNSVYLGGNGASSSYFLPTDLQGSDYSLTISNRRVEILLYGSSVSSAILTSGVASPDLNAKKGSSIVFANVNGAITVN